MGGSDAKEMMLIGNIFLQNHKPPKVVVLSLDMSAFAPAYAIRTRFPYLFYLGNDTIYKYVQQEYASAPAMRILPFLKYSLFDEYNRTSLFTNGRPYPIFEHNIYRGFLNIHKGEALNGDVKFHIPPDDSLIVSRRAKLYLQTIITNFLTAGSKVIIISPPEKPTRPGRRNTLHQMRDSMVNIVSSGKKINYFHFRTSPQLENKYFTDDIHLNERGARIFSLLLADSIKSVL